MKHIIAIALMLCAAASNACTSNPDRDMSAPDKRSHVQVSALIAASVDMLDDRLKWRMSTPQKFALALAPGLAREVLQGCTGARTGFSKADMLANAVGVALGLSVAPGLTIERQHGATAVVYRITF